MQQVHSSQAVVTRTFGFEFSKVWRRKYIGVRYLAKYNSCSLERCGVSYEQDVVIGRGEIRKRKKAASTNLGAKNRHPFLRHFVPGTNLEAQY
jgi:hypothetical protein